jgi:hypothetical protein
MRKIIRFIPVFCVLSLFACSNNNASSTQDRRASVGEGKIILAKSCGELDILQEEFTKSSMTQHDKDYLNWRLGEQRKALNCSN